MRRRVVLGSTMSSTKPEAEISVAEVNTLLATKLTSDSSREGIAEFSDVIVLILLDVFFAAIKN